MLNTIRRKLEQYEGQWMLPDDLDALLEIIGSAIAEGPEYAQGKSRTHWRECWRYTSHHACAVAEVERLRAALEEVLKWATGDGDQDLVETAAREALGESDGQAD